MNLADGTLRDQPAGLHHSGSETELEIDCGSQAFPAAEIADGSGLVKVSTHGLLDQDRSPAGRLFQHWEDRIGRSRQIEHRAFG